jgi:hypothetical protein
MDRERKLFEQGEEAARRLLEDNERLRLEIAERRRRAGAGDDAHGAKLPRQLLSAVETLEQEHSQACDALSTAEAENRQLAERCASGESQFDTLGSLYVSIHQLHSACDLPAVYRTLVEVAVNLIGAESLVVYGYDSKAGCLVARATEGELLSNFPRVEVGVGLVGGAVETGEIYVAEGHGSNDEPIICIPFRRGDEPVGAIAIYRLLAQKDGLSHLDSDLFELLAGHAATAICAARLYSESRAKLDTLNGFRELMRR